MANKLRKSVGGSNPAEWVIDSWRKGLNTLVSDTRVDPQESPDMLNMNLTEDGLPIKRGGTTAHRGSIGSRVRGLASYYTDSGSKYFVAAAAGTLYYDNGTAWTAIAASSGCTIPDANINFVQARDTLYIHSKTTLSQLSGITWTAPANGVSAEFGLYWKGRHVCAGNASNPSRVFISRADDAGYFITTGTDTTAEWFDVSKSDGDKITGLASFYDNLVIFKERSIHKAVPSNSSTGDFISKVETINRNIGCVSHRTIDSVDNDIFFLSRKGIFVLGNEPNFFDTIRTNEVSAKVHPEIDGITSTNFDKAVAFYHNYRYYLAYPHGGTTYNNRVLVYDTRYGAWTLHRGYNPNCFNAFIDSNNNEELYCGSDSSGYVWQMETGYGDNGNTIESYVKSYNNDLDSPDVTKFWMDTTCQFRNTQANVTVDVNIDGDQYKSSTFAIGRVGQSNGLGLDVLGQEVLGLSGGATITSETTSNVMKRFRLKKRGQSQQVKVSNISNNETWTLMSLRGTYRPLSHFVFRSTDKV